MKLLKRLFGFRKPIINKPVDCDSLKSAISEIENAMERWHLYRDNDAETLQKINDILVSIGMLGWFNNE